MPINTTDLLVFLTAALTLNLTPGNDMMYVLGQSIKGGARSGIAASFGIATGSFIHLVLVALGIAVVLTQYPAIFDAIRWAGAAYLVWIAYKTLTTPIGNLQTEGRQRSLFAAWRDGVLVNVFNPKTIIFMFAFLPPFIRPENGAPLMQLFILGMIFNIGGTAINCLVAAFAGKIGEMLAQSRTIARVFSLLSASLFLILAARMAFERR
ncbi:LysE family translocator [Aestuariivirga sp. YIM B02566]|uniref:LysE family translocator n=1 Tax=Taklimakanibacter albus TaxID=2800327 RepID=A0ACC5RD35_9HYPH|nr:LysE family translocator [Aestuariivirga sp. YIM B02566]MBK1870396.1 LysE family translocator [Aestuariivirga sp. YIM B02566]